MKDTIPHLYSRLAIVEIHLRPFPQHGLSRDHVVRLPRTTGGTPPPNFPARKYIFGPFGSQNLTVDLRRIYLTTRDLTS